MLEIKKKVIDRVALINTLAEIKAYMDVDLTKAKQKISFLQNNIIDEKGKIFKFVEV